MIEFLQIFFYIFFISASISLLFVVGCIFDFRWGNEFDDFFTMCKEHKILKITLPTLILSFIGLLISSGTINSLARNEIKNNLNEKEFIIKINDELVSNDDLINDFKNIRKRGNERISSNKKLKIEITDMKFTLVRHYSIDSLYSVYYDNYKSTSDNSMGKLISNTLKAY